MVFQKEHTINIPFIPIDANHEPGFFWPGQRPIIHTAAALQNEFPQRNGVRKPGQSGYRIVKTWRKKPARGALLRMKV